MSEKKVLEKKATEAVVMLLYENWTLESIRDTSAPMEFINAKM